MHGRMTTQSPLPYHPPHACLATVVLDMYAPVIGQSASTDARFHRLARRLADEASLASELLGLQGQVDLLLAASTSGGGGGAGGTRAAAGADDDGDV